MSPYMLAQLFVSALPALLPVALEDEVPSKEPWRTGPRAANSFVNWENAHVSPLALTPDGRKLLAVNTPDNRLEVFDTGAAELVHIGSIPVGVEPVSVRARTNTEVWVVDHVSDTVSLVDLESFRVVDFVRTDDEPSDVVFAGSPERAFVTCSQANTILVFDPEHLDLAPLRIPVEAEDPRALAVSPDGTKVYAAIFESGNGTTNLVGERKQSHANPVDAKVGPYGGRNPPPNAGTGFQPAMREDLPPPPRVSHIVRQSEDGRWLDDNEGDWSELVSGRYARLSGRPNGWTLVDRDVAVLDTKTLELTYVDRLMNLNMGIAVHPKDGRLTVVGTDGTNEIRFESNLRGTFLRVLLALVEPEGGDRTVLDLNPHLDYSQQTVPQAVRDRSLGDPRAVIWDANGDRLFVAGMGSNHVVLLDDTGQRVSGMDPIEVATGPTGLAFDGERERLYVLGKFEAAISVVDTATGLETQRLAFFDPTPEVIRAGRAHLYDTHATSGLGQASCASCHPEGRMDRLAWDLGDPTGDVVSLEDRNLGANLPFFRRNQFEAFHPMKGPMVTMTLQDVVGNEPFHWRGDRYGLEEFNSTYANLQGDDEVLSPEELQQLEDFLGTLTFGPNPFRTLDNGLADAVIVPAHATGVYDLAKGEPLPIGNARRGLEIFRPRDLAERPFKACVTCHTFPSTTGTNSVWRRGEFREIPLGPYGEHHQAMGIANMSSIPTRRVPSLRNVYERLGFSIDTTTSLSGFGNRHDGSGGTASAAFAKEVHSDQDAADLIAFVMSISGSDLPPSDGSSVSLPPGSEGQDTHAAVGWQGEFADPEWPVILGEAESHRIGLVARAFDGEQERGFAYLGEGRWQSDRSEPVWPTVRLAKLAVRCIAVPFGSEHRLGVDRDEDGVLDGDEQD